MLNSFFVINPGLSILNFITYESSEIVCYCLSKSKDVDTFNNL